jgi:hypothetical protein
MNLSAVAMTADSAVTMTKRVNGRLSAIQHQPGVDKVFLLDDKGPVGLMVYGGGDFGGCPWGVAFHAFRDAQPEPAKTVVAATQALVAFLAVADEDPRMPLTPDISEFNLHVYVFYAVCRFREIIESMKEADQSVVHDAPAAKKISLHRRALERMNQEARFYDMGDEPPMPRAKVADPSERLNAMMERYFIHFLDDALENVFPNELMTSDVKVGLGALIIETFLTDWIPPSPYRSGLVIAGFGQDDRTPSYVHLEVFGCIGGVLKYRVLGLGRTNGEDPLFVQGFAQSNPITAFLRGADPHFQAAAMLGLRHYLGESLAQLYLAIAQKDTKLAEALRPQMIDLLLRVPELGLDVGFGAYQHELHDKLRGMLETANGAALGAHAERLLQFAVLRHELTGDQTVAKPITTLQMIKGNAQFRSNAP